MIQIEPAASEAPGDEGLVIVRVITAEGGMGTYNTDWFSSAQARALAQAFNDAADAADQKYLDKEEADQAALDAKDPTEVTAS